MSNFSPDHFDPARGCFDGLPGDIANTYGYDKPYHCASCRRDHNS